MKLKVEQAVLANALNHLSKVAGSGNINPILNNVLLIADDDFLEITAVDYRQNMTMRIPAMVQESGTITAEAEKMTKWVKSVDVEEISISIDSQNKLRLKTKRSTSGIPTTPPDDYPLMSEDGFEECVYVNTGILADAITRASTACAVDTNRPVLNAVYIHTDGEFLYTVGVDGFRISKCVVPATIIVPDVFGALVAKDLITSLVGALKASKSDAVISIDTSRAIKIEFGNTKYLALQTNGEYPHYQTIMDGTEVTAQISVSTQEFAGSLQRIGLFTEIRPIFDLEVKDDILVLSIETQNEGSGVEEVPFEFVVEGRVISRMNINLLSEGVRLIGGNRLLIKYSPASSLDAEVKDNGILLLCETTKDELSHTYLVAPMT